MLSMVALCSASVHADVLPFTPDPSDISMRYLSNLFGNVGSVLTGANSQFMGQIFFWFNYGLIAVLMARVSFNVFTTVLLSSTEGSGISRKVKRLTALRSVAAAASLLPSFSGYSAIQVIMMTLIVQGVGLANAIWSNGLSYVVSVKGIIFSDYIIPSTDSGGSSGDDPMTMVEGGKHDDLRELVYWSDYKSSLQTEGDRLTNATAMNFFQSAVCAQLMYLHDRDGVGNQLFVMPEQYGYRVDEKCFGEEEYEQRLKEKARGVHHVCFGGPSGRTHQCGLYRYEYTVPSSDPCQSQESGMEEWESIKRTFTYDPGWRGIQSLVHTASTSGKAYASSALDHLKHGDSLDDSLDIGCTADAGMPERCHAANNLVAAATDVYIMTRGARLSMCRDQQQREMITRLRQMKSPDSIKSLVSSYIKLRQQIFDSQESVGNQSRDDLFAQYNEQLGETGASRDFFEYLLDNIDDFDGESLETIIESYSDTNKFNWVKLAQQEGWITAARYYNTLLSQGAKLGYNIDHNVTGFSSVVFYGNNIPHRGLDQLSIASFDGFIPKVEKKPTWVPPKGTRIETIYKRMIDVQSNIVSDASKMKVYADLAGKIVDKMMDVNHAVAESDHEHVIDNTIYSMSAANFISSMVYSQIRSPKWPYNGYSLTIPVSAASIGAAIPVAAGNLFAPAVMASGFAVGGGALISGLLGTALNVPLDHIKNHLYKMTNVVLSEFSGIKIYDRNLLNYKEFKNNRYDQISERSPCFDDDVVRHCAITDNSFYNSYSPQFKQRLKRLAGYADTDIKSSIVNRAESFGEDVEGTVAESDGVGEGLAGVLSDLTNIESSYERKVNKKTADFFQSSNQNHRKRIQACIDKAVSKGCIVQGKGMIGAYALEKNQGVYDPLAGMKQLGIAMMTTSSYYWSAVIEDVYDTTIKTHATAAAAKVAITVPVMIAMFAYERFALPADLMVKTGGKLLNELIDMVLLQDNALMKIGSTFGAAVAGIFYGLGSVLAIYLPMLPLFIFILATIGWLILAIEGMIAAPLVALGLAHPAQHDLLGKANEAGSLLLMIFIRPSTILLGYFTSMILMYVSMRMLNQGMMWYLGTELQLGGLTSHFSVDPLARLLMLASVLMLYVYVVYQILNQCFSLMYKIPEKIMRWIDPGHREPTAQMIEQATDEGRQQMESGTRGVSSATGQVAQKERTFKIHGFHTSEREMDEMVKTSKNLAKNRWTTRKMANVVFGHSKVDWGYAKGFSLKSTLNRVGNLFSGAASWFIRRGR